MNINSTKQASIGALGTVGIGSLGVGSLEGAGTLGLPQTIGASMPSIIETIGSVGASFTTPQVALMTVVASGVLLALPGEKVGQSEDEEKAAVEAANQKKKNDKGDTEWVGNPELPGRNGALNQAKRDAGIPKSQQPDSVEYAPMRSAEYEGGHVIKDENGNVVNTREYHYTNGDGESIIIQEHSAGHTKGDQGPHFNVRPASNPRTGSVPGTLDHYPFK